MERLTEKVNGKWQTNCKANINYIDTNESVFVGNAITRLAEFEDFMEENGFKDLKEFKRALEFMRAINISGVKQFAQNQELEAKNKDCNDGMDCQEAADELVPKLYKEIEELKKENQILIKGEYARCCKTCCAFDEQEAIARDYYNECEEYKKQLAEIANNIIKQVKELSVFDFKAYEEHDFKRYTITDIALDNILKKYKVKD